MIKKTRGHSPDSPGDGVRPTAASTGSREILGVEDENVEGVEEQEPKRQRVDPPDGEEAEEQEAEGETWLVDGETFGERMTRLGISRESPARKLLYQEFMEIVQRERGNGETDKMDGEGGVENVEGDGCLPRGYEVGQEEGRDVRSKRPPQALSEQEWRAHRVSHYPYRSWCPDCVAGRGVASAHRRRHEDDHSPLAAEFHFDDCLLRNRAAKECATTLVGVDKRTQGALAHVVPEKGSRFDGVATQLERDVRRFGYHGRLVVESDCENAVGGVTQELARKRHESPTVIEKSVPYDSNTNGRPENAVRWVEAQVRALKVAFERSTRREL